MVVSIDAARVSNPGVVFSYRNNPNVTVVFPSNTIPSGGITLTFTGVNLDVVQLIVLEVYHQPMLAPLVSYPIASNFRWLQILNCSYLYL